MSKVRQALGRDTASSLCNLRGSVSVVKQAAKQALKETCTIIVGCARRHCSNISLLDQCLQTRLLWHTQQNGASDMARRGPVTLDR